MSNRTPRPGQDRASATLSDDSDNTLLDIGSLNEVSRREIDQMELDVALGGHTQVDIDINVDINGSLVTHETLAVSADGKVDLSDFTLDPILSSRIQITAAGDTASPTSNGSVDATFLHTTVPVELL